MEHNRQSPNQFEVKARLTGVDPDEAAGKLVGTVGTNPIKTIEGFKQLGEKGGRAIVNDGNVVAVKFPKD